MARKQKMVTEQVTEQETPVLDLSVVTPLAEVFGEEVPEMHLPMLSPAMDPAYEEDLSGLKEPVSEARELQMQDVVEITEIGHLTPLYVAIDAEIGTRGGKAADRWFKKSEVHSFRQDGKNVVIQLRRELLDARGVPHESLEVIVAVDPVVEEAEGPLHVGGEADAMGEQPALEA